MNYSKEEVETLARSMSEEARVFFRSGFNCAEAVIAAAKRTFPKEIPPALLRSATSLGGGVGGSGNFCGAINAGALVIGALKGRTSPEEDPEAKRLTGIYMARLSEETPYFNCSDIRDAFPTEEAADRNCERLIGLCARLAVEIALG